MVGEVEESGGRDAMSETVIVGGIVRSELLGLPGYSMCEAKSSWACIESRLIIVSCDATEVGTSAACCREEGRP
jgi:hypothetical protein